MKVSREIKKKEAIKRMKKMHIFKDAIKQFEKEDVVMISEPPLGGLYWLDEKQKEMVANFEKEYNALVFLVVRSHTNIGMMDSIFYVSDHENEWEIDNMDIEDKCSMVYVVNHDDEYCSELGTIGWKSVGGGILRVF